MSVLKVAILGFGTVGEGVYRTIHTHREQLQAILGKKVEVAAVLIKNKQKERNIANDVLITTDFEEILRLPQLDVVVEAIVGKDPTFLFLQKAIQKGCHIISANKEMFAHYGKDLLRLAKENNVSVGFEATVGGGIPIIQTVRQLLKVNRVHQIQGIINGTSNFILTEMRAKKQSFADALALAQKNGFAEADPTNDVEGFDAFYKLMILSRIAFGAEPDWQDVEREGITSITSELIEAAAKLGLRFKHVASICKAGSQLKGSVRPGLVGKSHPFYHVEGVENAINVHTDIVGRITLQGPGAGMFPTASAVIEDLVYVCKNNHPNLRDSKTTSSAESIVRAAAKDFWLIQRVDNHFFNSSITKVEQLSTHIYLIEATKEEVSALVKQDGDMNYFPIEGYFEFPIISKQESLSGAR